MSTPENTFYEGRIFRPPSEAYSLIIQSTVGCSHNKCNFCSMYYEKQFHVRPLEVVKRNISAARRWYQRVERVFLSDGDALIRKMEDQIEILNHVKKVFPECERVTCYASPRSILLKSREELTRLRELGLKMLYLGLETGSDALLEWVGKGATVADMLAAAERVHSAGMDLSVMVINGLGGPAHWEEHAVKSGEALTIMKPKYISLLTLRIQEGARLYDEWARGDFVPHTPDGLLEEARLMLEHMDCEGSIFRANHASNYVDLKGTLNADKPRLIATIDKALEGKIRLKPDWCRGL